MSGGPRSRMTVSGSWVSSICKPPVKPSAALSTAADRGPTQCSRLRIPGSSSSSQTMQHHTMRQPTQTGTVAATRPPPAQIACDETIRRVPMARKPIRPTLGESSRRWLRRWRPRPLLPGR